MAKKSGSGKMPMKGAGKMPYANCGMGKGSKKK